MNDPLSQTFSALADPTRRAILAQLSRGDASVIELAKPFEMTPQAVSKHVGVLERAGLVSRRREAQRNVSHLEPGPLVDVEVWLAEYRRLWKTRFDNIDDLLARIKNGEVDDPRK
ncbi:MAG: ArsR family transcriptional regulator [Mesorhizobium sp.]|uniref:ArsR/SmtB family transcription factor n=1 Tax=Mesorhizobium sp. TaxID=1871066 RepID=UPI000FE61DD7|nr:metalloregulator ArsR/SmtB family transcription factor [Mesorhizobium sp.]RWI57037.1 MAG: ArsR family transcriptional regulator [Mesorhizobium sp.]